MVDSQMMPNQVTTIMGRAHLAMQEWLLNKFAKSWAEVIVMHVMQLWWVQHMTGHEGVEYMNG